jgi:AbiV family abortive infection protein
MTARDPRDEISFCAVEDAIAHGGALYDNRSSDGFDRAIMHIATLTEDAFACYGRQSFGTVAFLAVTIIEETVKAEVGIFRRDSEPAPGAKRKADPLRSHASKHRIAVNGTVWMGGRLRQALGVERCARLREEAESGGLVRAREAGLYFDRVGDQFITPQEAVGCERAWELLLLAIEVVDDRLVGYTNRSFELGQRLDEMFAVLTAPPPSEPASS